jgi:hypothetical protein
MFFCQTLYFQVSTVHRIWKLLSCKAVKSTLTKRQDCTGKENLTVYEQMLYTNPHVSRKNYYSAHTRVVPEVPDLTYRWR